MILSSGGDHLLAVKANRPTLPADTAQPLALWRWHPIRDLAFEEDRAAVHVGRSPRSWPPYAMPPSASSTPSPPPRSPPPSPSACHPTLNRPRARATRSKCRAQTIGSFCVVSATRRTARAEPARSTPVAIMPSR